MSKGAAPVVLPSPSLIPRMLSVLLLTASAGCSLGIGHTHIPWYIHGLEIPHLSLVVANLHCQALGHVAVITGAHRDGQLLDQHSREHLDPVRRGMNVLKREGDCRGV